MAEAARLFSVDKRTVSKWLKDESIIPSSEWYRLPGSGYIRIRKAAILRLMGV
ncbi:conserved hypothetical protein [delta proteobacterium NaphS2]|nr:conserved hypothetical protein [delta proteobacterium NaphS2]